MVLIKIAVIPTCNLWIHMGKLKSLQNQNTSMLTIDFIFSLGLLLESTESIQKE